MHRYTTFRTALALILMALTLPALLGAAEPENDETSDEQKSTVVIIGEDGEELTVTLGDGELTIVTTEDGEISTSIMDMDAVGLLVEDSLDLAMLEMDGVLEHLQDMQFQVRMGADNRLNLNYAESEFELDLDQIMTQVAAAVQLGLDEIDTAEWASHGHRWDDEATDDELRDELDTLKDEMKELRRELRRLQKENQ